MLLSWAGQPLGYIAEKLTDKDAVVNAATTAFMALHEAQILHCDAEPRNVLYDMSNGKLMIVDFERSAVCDRQSLNSISPNRKRKQDMLGKDSSDNFAMEMRSAERAIRNLRFG
ncbi:hypothetical protein F4819DRAFT_456797 [Hypoxylon fuscum]|nr:hypothetical protein F4819DRAFT_456797 [Hypoxylon fuscum]